MKQDSRRERSKARRRRAIQWAGMRLFAERGYEATTIADIAEAADVAPRTVAVHFPSKLDIALTSSTEAVERLGRAIDEQAVDANVVDTLMNWIVSEIRDVDPEEWRLRSAMLSANPALGAAASGQNELLARKGVPVLARALDTREDDPALRLALGAIGGAFEQFDLLDGGARDRAATLDALRAVITGIISELARAIDAHRPQS